MCGGGQTFGENDVIGCFAVSAPKSCGFVAKMGRDTGNSICFSSAATFYAFDTSLA